MFNYCGINDKCSSKQKGEPPGHVSLTILFEPDPFFPGGSLAVLMRYSTYLGNTSGHCEFDRQTRRSYKKQRLKIFKFNSSIMDLIGDLLWPGWTEAAYLPRQSRQGSPSKQTRLEQVSPSHQHFDSNLFWSLDPGSLFLNKTVKCLEEEEDILWLNVSEVGSLWNKTKSNRKE